MTRDLTEAIAIYAKHPTGLHREVVVRLVRDGHLCPQEYKRLAWAMQPWLEKASVG